MIANVRKRNRAWQNREGRIW